MRQMAKRIVVAFLCLGIVLLGGCFVRTRIASIAAQHRRGPPATATKEELIQRVHDIFDPVQSFLMIAEFAPTVGRLYGGELKDYAIIPGYVLFAEPDSIRILGMDPVIHTTIFDMVSVGKEFREL